MPSTRISSWRRFLVALGGVLMIVLFLGIVPQGAHFVIDSDREIYDRIIRSGGGPAEREDFVLLGVDEASLSFSNVTEQEFESSELLQLMSTRFPWDRRVWAKAIDRLCEAGAKLVVLDLLFLEPATAEEDEAMAAAIARHPDKVILASAFSSLGQQHDNHEVFVIKEPYVQFLESDPEPRIGFVNFWPDKRDGSIRLARFRSSVGKENNKILTGEPEMLSLAGQIMDAYGVEVPEGDVELRFASEPGTLGTEIYAPRSVNEIFLDAFWETNYDHGRFFKDKLVLIGPVAERYQDIHETPVGTITGPQLHLQAAACGLAQAYVHHAGHPLLVMSLLGLIAAAIAAGIEKTRASAAAIVILLLGFAVLVGWMGKYQSVMIPVVGGMIAAAVGWTSAQIYQLVHERMQKDRLRGVFRRFVSRDVADRLVDQPEAWQAIAEGRKRRVVVLFSDVRDFTSRSEVAEPTELVKQLNEYLTAMVAVVFRHGGTLDKFIGDAVMAHWGSLDDNEKGEKDGDYSRAALAAAREMHVELKRLNERWAKEGREPFRMGVGIHLGEVVAGELGSPERIEFGVIGDAVNLASRIEGLTKAFESEVIFSSQVNDAAGPSGAQCIGAVRVKGRSAPVDLFAYGDSEQISKALSGYERDGDGAIVMKSK